MNGNSSQSEEQGAGKKPDIRPRWRKKRWWVVGLFLTWYLHPLVWQIPGLWYLPLPLQCEYGDYDSAAIRKLVREARAMRGGAKIVFDDRGVTSLATHFQLPFEQSLQDFVSKAKDRDQTLARIHAFILANGGTIIAERIFRGDNKNGKFENIYFESRFNFMNFGFYYPYPLYRTGIIKFKIRQYISYPNYLIYIRDFNRKKGNIYIDEYISNANIKETERFIGMSASFLAYFPWRTSDKHLTWGVVNTCLPRSELPEHLTIHRQDIAEIFHVPTHKNNKY